MLSEHIRFIFEKKDEHSELPFLDFLVKRNSSRSLNLAVYRKPAHSNRLINFNTATPSSAEISLALNVFRRATKIITTEDKLEQKDIGSTSYLRTQYVTAIWSFIMFIVIYLVNMLRTMIIGLRKLCAHLNVL